MMKEALKLVRANKPQNLESIHGSGEAKKQLILQNHEFPRSDEQLYRLGWIMGPFGLVKGLLESVVRPFPSVMGPSESIMGPL